LNKCFKIKRDDYIFNWSWKEWIENPWKPSNTLLKGALKHSYKPTLLQ